MSESERSSLVAFLDKERDLVAACLGRLDDTAARSTPTASPLSCLGVVKHLAYVERWWFVHCMVDESDDFIWTKSDPDADFRVEDADTVESIGGFYRRECDRARGIVAVGLGGEEARYPPEPFAPAFRAAREEGLGSVPHAGDIAPIGNGRDAGPAELQDDPAFAMFEHGYF